MKKIKRNFLYLFFACLLVPISAQAQWWKEVTFYQIYMPSFHDSNADGYSDFPGMTQRLDYIQSLGVKGIWLTPFLKSPKVDNGYDVADYYQIDSTYGNLNDFKSFLNEAHKRDIKVIMDMVVNHTSTDCYWFQESRKSKDNPYRGYYIWKDRPNNWESFFGGEAWQFDSLSNQYYLHKFDVRMADLNWTNSKVAEEIADVLRFWLDLGIDGFRFDVINFLTTDDSMKDNPIVDGKKTTESIINQAGTEQAIALLKSVVNEYPDRFTVGEIGSDDIQVLKQYQSPRLMDVVFNFNFGSIPEFSVEKLFNELKSMEKEMSGYPTLFFGSHDNPRLMSRLADNDVKRAEALAVLMLTAKGVPFIYFGEEIGMQNITAKHYGEIVDIQGKTHYRLAIEAGKTPEEALVAGNENSRDKSRSPMQWNDKQYAGFSTVQPWIKLNDNYHTVNVENLEKNKNSILHTYKKLLALRNSEEVLQYGEYEQLDLNDNAIYFTRIFKNEKISVIINFGQPVTHKLPPKAKILLGSNRLRANGFLVYKH